MLHSALISFLFMFCINHASEHCNWKDMEVQDTLDVFLLNKIVGKIIYGFDYNEKAALIVNQTDLWIDADGSGKGSKGNRIEVRETRTFNASGSLASAYQELAGQSGTNTWALKRNPDGWDLTIIVGGQKTEKKIPSVSDNLLSDCRMRHEIKNGSMRIGKQWRDTVFEIMSGRSVAISTVCTSIDTLRGRWTFESVDDVSGRTEICILGSNGETIERSIEGIYTAKRRSPQGNEASPLQSKTRKAAPSGFQPGARSITELFIVPSDHACPEDESLAVIVKDSTLSLDSSVHFLYKKQGRAWLLRAISRRCPHRSTAPPDSGLRQWLKAGIAIQSDHPKIIELAAKLRGKETNPCVIVSRFNHYVFSHVQKKSAAVFSNALETLNAGFGDCGEHAALLTALLRAAGVPARVALGLLYVKSKKGYFYHAQVMAYVGEWIFADPTWDVFPASGRFVPLIIDDTGTKAMLLSRLIGRIRIEYVNKSG